MPTIAAPRRPARHARPTSLSLDEVSSKIADVAAYWLVLGSIYIAFGFLWYYSAKEKLFDQSGTIVFLLVLFMPPYRQRYWLTGLLDR